MKRRGRTAWSGGRVARARRGVSGAAVPHQPAQGCSGRRRSGLLRTALLRSVRSAVYSGPWSGGPKSGLEKSGLLNLGRVPEEPSFGLVKSGPL